MDTRVTQRGFTQGSFEDRYGSQCSIQGSSVATERCIWLGVDKPFNGQVGTRMHLTQAMVAELLPMLQHFVATGELPGDEPVYSDAAQEALAIYMAAADHPITTDVQQEQLLTLLRIYIASARRDAYNEAAKIVDQQVGAALNHAVQAIRAQG